MKNFKLTGFGSVFSFTFKSHIKSKKFISSTLIVGLLIVAGILLALIIASKPDRTKEEDYEMKIKKVYVADETGYGVPAYQAIAAAMNDEKIGGIEFVKIDNAVEFAKEKEEEDPELVILNQTESDESFLLTIVSGVGVNGDDISVLRENLPSYFQNYILSNSGLEQEQMVQALMPIEINLLQFGEERDETKKTVIMISLFVSVMLVYFMILFYGQSVCTEVSIEKTSKLVEQMLTNVTPYGLVSGKILASIAESLFQFLIWIVLAAGALFGGNALAKSIWGIDKNMIDSISTSLSEMFSGNGFSPANIILAILLLALGIVFYMIIAGLGGSMVTKPEEAPNMQVIFIIPMMISFFIVLYTMMEAPENTPVIYALIPFTGAMCAPGMMLAGTLSLTMGLICIAIYLVFSLLILWIAARIYRGLMFFNDAKLSPKLIISVIKGK